MEKQQTPLCSIFFSIFFLQKERIFIACKFYLLGIHQEYMSGVLAFNFLLFVMMHTISFLLSACDMYHQHIYKSGAIYSEDVSTYMFGRKDRIIVVDDNKPFCAVFLCAYFRSLDSEKVRGEIWILVFFQESFSKTKLFKGQHWTIWRLKKSAMEIIFLLRLSHYK